MFTAVLALLVFCAAAFAIRSCLIGNSRTSMDERMLKLSSEIENLKVIADNATSCRDIIKARDARENKINSLVYLVRLSKGQKIELPKNVVSFPSIADPKSCKIN